MHSESHCVTEIDLQLLILKEMFKSQLCELIIFSAFKKINKYLPLFKCSYLFKLKKLLFIG